MNQIPLVEAFPLAHTRVKHRHRIAEASTKARDRLWRERDLGHEHDRIAPRLQLFLDRAEKHFSLTRPRNAIEHYHFPAGALLSRNRSLQVQHFDRVKQGAQGMRLVRPN